MPHTEIKGYASETTQADLAYLSEQMERSQEDLVSEAVAEFATRQATKMRKAHDGWADYQAGNLASDEEVDAFFDDWMNNG